MLVACRIYCFLALTLALGVCLAGCGTSALPTPVKITYRPSLVGVGQVIVVTNTSSHHLYNVTIVARNLKQVSSASVKAADHLAPGASVEVGWLELETWVPEPGETVEVYADKYLTPSISVVPK